MQVQATTKPERRDVIGPPLLCAYTRMQMTVKQRASAAARAMPIFYRGASLFSSSSNVLYGRAPRSIVAQICISSSDEKHKVRRVRFLVFCQFSLRSFIFIFFLSPRGDRIGYMWDPSSSSPLPVVFVFFNFRFFDFSLSQFARPYQSHKGCAVLVFSLLSKSRMSHSAGVICAARPEERVSRFRFFL